MEGMGNVVFSPKPCRLLLAVADAAFPHLSSHGAVDCGGAWKGGGGQMAPGLVGAYHLWRSRVPCAGGRGHYQRSGETASGYQHDPLICGIQKICVQWCRISSTEPALCNLSSDGLCPDYLRSQSLLGPAVALVPNHAPTVRVLCRIRNPMDFRAHHDARRLQWSGIRLPRLPQVTGISDNVLDHHVLV